MKKLLIVPFLMILSLIPLTGCGDNYLDERHEHGNVVCVYRVHRNFWGTRQTEKVVVCQ